MDYKRLPCVIIALGRCSHAHMRARTNVLRPIYAGAQARPAVIKYLYTNMNRDSLQTHVHTRCPRAQLHWLQIST